MSYGNILQIMPVQPGWEAVYAINKHKKGQNYTTSPLTNWALVEFRASNGKDYTTIVVGMATAEAGSPVIDFVDKLGDFIGYNYPGCGVDWHIQADKYHRRTVDHPQQLTSTT